MKQYSRTWRSPIGQTVGSLNYGYLEFFTWHCESFSELQRTTNFMCESNERSVFLLLLLLLYIPFSNDGLLQRASRRCGVLCVALLNHQCHRRTNAFKTLRYSGQGSIAVLDLFCIGVRFVHCKFTFLLLRGFWKSYFVCFCLKFCIFICKCRMLWCLFDDIWNVSSWSWGYIHLNSLFDWTCIWGMVWASAV